VVAAEYTALHILLGIMAVNAHLEVQLAALEYSEDLLDFRQRPTPDRAVEVQVT
jgi:hypothetical protein